VSPTTSRIARVIDELVLERQHLAARLEKVDAAIATMRELFHLPNGKPTAKARGTKNVPESSTNGDTVKAAIRKALAKHGPLSPGDLGATVGKKPHKLRYFLAQMETAGEVETSGSTARRRIALAGTPAKEAPQR
jgi:hypothetical protein